MKRAHRQRIGDAKHLFEEAYKCLRQVDLDDGAHQAVVEFAAGRAAEYARKLDGVLKVKAK